MRPSTAVKNVKRTDVVKDSTGKIHGKGKNQAIH